MGSMLPSLISLQAQVLSYVFVVTDRERTSVEGSSTILVPLAAISAVLGAVAGIWYEWADEVKEICAAGGLTVSRVHTHIGSGSDPAVWQKVRT